MKRKFLLPVFAVILAASGAFASNRFAPVYFNSGDSTCTGEPLEEPVCTPGDDEQCLNGTTPYYYIPDNSVPEPECKILYREN